MTMTYGLIVWSFVGLVGLLAFLFLSMGVLALVRRLAVRSSVVFRISVGDVLVRIAAFVVFYLLLIVLGAFLLVFFGTCLISSFDSGKPSFRGIVMLGLLALTSVLFGVYLVSALFQYRRDESPERVEVTRTECPRLFAMLDGLVRRIGCTFPKHVYLTTDTNACVFYNTGFWNIFLPVRKNLEVGLGLFVGTSVGEVEGVVAHEFGHFAQSSMKVGSSVSVAVTVIRNIVTGGDWFDWWMEHMPGVVALVAAFATLLARRGSLWLYELVDGSYGRLSRQMEFDADSVAARAVGSNVFASVLCKLPVLAEAHDVHQSVVGQLGQKGQVFPDYFEGRRIVDGFATKPHAPKISADCLLTEPARVFAKSRVQIIERGESHPPLEDRLANIRGLPSARPSSGEQSPAWELVPPEIVSRVTDRFHELVGNACEKKLDPVGRETFVAVARGSFAKASIANPLLERFFDRQVLVLDVDKAVRVPVGENPFTTENADTLARYDVAKEDCKLMADVKLGSVKADRVVYDGRTYSRKNIPLEEHTRYMLAVEREAIAIAESVCSWIYARLDEADRPALCQAYRDMMTCWQKNGTKGDVQNVSDAYDKLVELLDAERQSVDQNIYKEMCRQIDTLFARLRDSVRAADFDLLRETCDDDGQRTTLEGIGKYVTMAPAFYTDKRLDAEAVQALLSTAATWISGNRCVWRVCARKICHLVEDGASKAAIVPAPLQ